MKRPDLRSCAVLGLACVLAAGPALLPTALAASATWAPQTVLASDFVFSESDSNPNVAVSTTGQAVSAWDRPSPSTGMGFGGPKEVHAAVYRATRGTWSAATRLSPVETPSANAGAVVDPSSGKVTVAWSAAGLPYVSSSSDGGASWVSSAVPVAAGFAFLSRGNLIDTDAKGNLTFILLKARAAGDG